MEEAGNEAPSAVIVFESEAFFRESDDPNLRFSAHAARVGRIPNQEVDRVEIDDIVPELAVPEEGVEFAKDISQRLDKSGSN